MGFTIDPTLLEEGVELGVEALAAAVALPPGVGDVLAEVLGPLVNWIATSLEGGGDPKGALLTLALASADAAANAAEAAKFPPAAGG